MTLWFTAVYTYLYKDQLLGQQCILEMDRYKEWDSRTFRLFRERLRDIPYVFNSYCKGTSPDNQYTIDPDKFEIVFKGDVNRKPYEDRAAGEFVKVTVISSGADNPRSMTLQRNNKGEYKVYEFSSIFVGIRKPHDPKDGDF